MVRSRFDPVFFAECLDECELFWRERYLRHQVLGSMGFVRPDELEEDVTVTVTAEPEPEEPSTKRTKT